MSEPACPHPMDDPEGYALWCEMHACTTCYGTGMIDGDYDGEERECRACDGSGIDPVYDEPADNEYED